METFNKSFIDGEFLFSDFRVYFDDGDASFKQYIFPKLNNYLKRRIKLAIVTDWIDKKNYLNKEDLINYVKEGVGICAHSASHSALAVFRDGNLQRSLPNGRYKNSPFGQGEILTEEEIRYQLKEPLLKLNSLGIYTNEFVYPHGLYNKDTMAMNYQFGYYKYMSTCDEYLDSGQLIRPRFLIESDRSIDNTIKRIKSLQIISSNNLLTKYEQK
jgi:hypothetical protein